MAIPEFNELGVLPAGVHGCTLEEIKSRLGSFQGLDCRIRLFDKLVELFAAMKQSGFFEALLIDRSFVTTKAAPNDIDILAELRPGQKFERDLSVSEYAVLSRSLLRRCFGLDVVVAERDSVLYRSYVEFFCQVREAPGVTEGLLRLAL
jgi:hypothetical protein